MEFIYENPDIVQVFPKAVGISLLPCRKTSKVTAGMPEGLDVDVKFVDDCLGLFVQIPDQDKLTLILLSADTPDNRVSMQDLLICHCWGLHIPAYDRVHDFNHVPWMDSKPEINPLLRQAQDLRQAYGNSLKLGIFKGETQAPLGWTTLDYLELQDILEFLERGYVLKPVD